MLDPFLRPNNYGGEKGAGPHCEMAPLVEVQNLSIEVLSRFLFFRLQG